MDRLVGRLAARWTTLGPSQKASFVAIVLLLVVASVIARMMLLTPHWEVLYTGLTSQDIREMRAELSDLGIASRVSRASASLEVHSADIKRARIGLGDAGLPGETAGLQILAPPPGATPETLKDMRRMALEGEMSRAFSALAPVRHASVRIVLREGESGPEHGIPSQARVEVDLHRGAHLSQAQAKAMVHLLLRSVPNAHEANIVIVTTGGKVVWDGCQQPKGDHR
jgi:flagellar biosynthesis/type III secretory pathway M-ring protein FliF/YscJ